jgi:hypothetical protein
MLWDVIFYSNDGLMTNTFGGDLYIMMYYIYSGV